MTILSEHRLIFRRYSDFGLKGKPVSRVQTPTGTISATEANAARQATQHQAAVAQNQAAGEIVTRQAAPGGPLAAPSAPLNPRSSAGQAAAARPKGVTQDTNTAARAIRMGLVDTANMQRQPGESQGAFEERRTMAEQQNTEKQQQMTEIEERQKKQREEANQMKGETEIQTPGAEGTTQTPTGTLLDTLKNLAATNPEMAAFIPQIEQMMGGTSPETIRDDALADIDATDKDGDGVTDGVQEAFKTSSDMLTEQKNEQDLINLENKSIAEEAAKIAKDMAQLEKDKFELSQLRNENLLREQNIEAEIKNRRAAARMGITADTNGLKWMSEEVRKGNEALAFLTQAGDIQSSQFSLQIGRQYVNDIKTVLNNYDAQQAQIDNWFKSALSDLKNTVTLDAKERRQEKAKAWEKYWDRKADKDKEAFGFMKDITLKLMDQANERKKAELEGIIGDGDALDFAIKIEDSINGSQEVKNFKDINFFYQGMKGAAEVYAADPSTKGAFDTALVKLYEKILDPTSVVRQEEFESQIRSQGLVRGQIQRAIDAFQGGQGLDPEMQQALLKMAGSLYESGKATTLQTIQPKLSQVARFNRQNGANVSLTEVLTPDIIEALDIPVDEFEEASTMIDGDTGETVEAFEPPADMQSWISMVGNGQVVHGSPFHTGIDAEALDIDGEIGDPIPAVVAGTVTSIGKNRKGGYGVSVVVTDDEGVEHLYGHLDEATIKHGQRVEAGMVIGKMGNTGNVIAGQGKDGAHLHYRRSQGGQAVALGQPKGTAGKTEVGGNPPPAPKPQPKPVAGPFRMGQGSLPGMGPGAMNTGQISMVPAKRYRNLETGAIVTVQPRQSDPYASKPYLFEPLS